MKYLVWAVGIIVGLSLAFLGIQTLASERVEVVELYTIDESGEEVITRLWVVDDEGYQYLRVGADGSRWFPRSQSNGEIQPGRNGNTGRYNTVLRHDKAERINELMQQKYTWGDTFFATFFGGREGSIPIEMRPKARE